jgi:hypothetical protein
LATVKGPRIQSVIHAAGVVISDAIHLQRLVP